MEICIVNAGQISNLHMVTYADVHGTMDICALANLGVMAYNERTSGFHRYSRPELPRSEYHRGLGYERALDVENWAAASGIKAATPLSIAQ